jgi:hypothetical protein
VLGIRLVFALSAKSVFHIESVTGDKRATSFLLQRVSLPIQRCRIYFRDIAFWGKVRSSFGIVNVFHVYICILVCNFVIYVVFGIIVVL